MKEYPSEIWLLSATFVDDRNQIKDKKFNDFQKAQECCENLMKTGALKVTISRHYRKTK